MRFMYVYILRCCDDSYYVGVTNDYETRFGLHQAGINPTCYTFKRRPLQIVYVEEFTTITDAIAREKQIKRWSRKKKEALINGKYEYLPSMCLNAKQRRVREIQCQLKDKYVMVRSLEP